MVQDPNIQIQDANNQKLEEQYNFTEFWDDRYQDCRVYLLCIISINTITGIAEIASPLTPE